MNHTLEATLNPKRSRSDGPSIGSDSLSSTTSRKLLTFQKHFRPLKRMGQRSMAIEFTLIALLTAFAAFQVLSAAGAKAGSI
jgi:hypothetical protein